MTNIENRQHIIVEGSWLPPEYIRDFESEYLEQIISSYISFSRDYNGKYLDLGIIEHRSEIEEKDCDDYNMNQYNFIKLHSLMKELCKKNNTKFFEINDDYVEEMVSVYNWIDEQVKTKWQLK